MRVEKKKLVADTIVDILSERESTSETMKYKRGFFLKKSFIGSRTTLKSKSLLITENFLLQEGKVGKSVKIPAGAILTPLARILIEEGKVKVDRTI